METKFLREDLVGKKFFDSGMYPRGFHRSGDFSIRESDLLTHHGKLCSALESGLVSNPNEEDLQFIAVCQGEREAETPLEKAWIKYKTRSKRHFVHLVESEKFRAKSDDSDSDTGDEIEDDDLIDEPLID